MVESGNEEIPRIQKFYDSIPQLFIASMVIFFVSYMGWGLYEALILVGPAP